MSWGSVIVAVLQLLSTAITWLHSRRWIKAGEDAAVARAALEVLSATDEGRRLYDLVTTMPEDEALSLWKRMLRDDPLD